jgi:hypothetical protein
MASDSSVPESESGRSRPLDLFAAFDRVKRSSTFSAFSSGIGVSLVLKAAGAFLGFPAITTLTFSTIVSTKVDKREKDENEG